MQKKGLLTVVLLLLVSLIAACGITGPVTEVPRANVLKVPYLKQVSLNPSDEVWGGTVPLNVPLTGMDIKGEWPVQLTPTVRVSALRDQEAIYFRMSWNDPTRDDNWLDIDSFVDAVAVQIPVKSDSEPYICMGQENGLVNILYWRAGEEKGQNLLGGGYGSLTALEEDGLPLKAEYLAGSWNVVIARPLAPQEKQLLTGRQWTTAFAVWNGADQQRGGRKSTSQWITLSFEQPGT